MTPMAEEPSSSAGAAPAPATESRPKSSSSSTRPSRATKRLSFEDEYEFSDDEDERKRKAKERTAAAAAQEAKQPEPKPKKKGNPWKSLPDMYLTNPKAAVPILSHLDALEETASLQELMAASKEDVRLHTARVRAGLQKDTRLVKTYRLEEDDNWIGRRERKATREEMMVQLKTQAKEIIECLDAEASKKKMTQAERTRERLTRWQRALELYVYSPQDAKLDLLGLLEKLVEGCDEDELSDALEEATRMCSTLVDMTSTAVKDCMDDAAEAEDAYFIQLEAHSKFATGATQETEDIQAEFRTHGQAALQIGQQLELAEAKRRQCESASILVKRWWMLEDLAEQEAALGEELRVDEEVRGVVQAASCRMDPLFTDEDQALDASKTLKALRTVVKKRGNSASGMVDRRAARRFDLTSSLIQRTSVALEGRLLNNFSDIYIGGGTYDFESPQVRSGRLDWRKLKELATALKTFDQGRNLYKRYVQLVISSRFPELFHDMNSADDDDDEFDMDATRSTLSTLFHRVSEVCNAEFELIAHVFDNPLQVARTLLQQVISDPQHGLQARIHELLESIDRKGDFDAGAKKLDTFVVIHEKAAGLFSMLKDAAQRMVAWDASETERHLTAKDAQAIKSLVQFLTSQEIALNNSHRRGYLNLELRLLHHECCSDVDRIGCVLVKEITGEEPTEVEPVDTSEGMAEFEAPVLTLDKENLTQSSFSEILNGPLKQSALRQPLIYATDSLARARLMFGAHSEMEGDDQEGLSKVVLSVFSQLCNFYGEAFLYPIMESLCDKLETKAPAEKPQLPFDESLPPHDLGVDASFWVAIERIHSAAKAFDRELWAENRKDSIRVWEILVSTRNVSNMTAAKERRIKFFQELEQRGEATIMKALDTLSTHIQWILVAGGEGMLATGGTRILHHLTGQFGGPYAVPVGSSLETPNSPAIKSLTFCLRSQFVHIQAALTPHSLAAFWTALSVRLYDILVARLLQHYYVSTVGAVILSRDVEALRSVAMLAGENHSHWDNLRELLTLYMTPPEALKTMLVGPEGDINSGKGLFASAGKDQVLVFMSRRVDYRYKTGQGLKKSGWALELLNDLGIQDPTDGTVSIGKFAAERKS